MSDFDFEGRGRPVVVREEGLEVVSKEESVDVKAREVLEDSSFG